jgi:hypothetical protein
MLRYLIHKKPMSFEEFKKKVLGINDDIDAIADKECKQLEIIKNSIMKRFNIDEMEALIKSLDILDDLKLGGLLK